MKTHTTHVEEGSLVWDEVSRANKDGFEIRIYGNLSVSEQDEALASLFAETDSIHNPFGFHNITV